MVSLDSCSLRDEGLAVLLDGLQIDHLRNLVLSHTELTPAGIVRLAECDKLASLRALDIGSNEIGDDAAAALADSPHLRQLLHLDLGQADIGLAGVMALASSPILANLLTLDLGYNALHAEGARLLADSPHLGGLARLSLRSASIGLSGVRDLVLSDRLAGLAAIDLAFNPIDQVRWDDRMTLEGWRELCRFPASPNPSTDEIRALCAALREGSPPLRRHVAPILERQWRERHAAMPVEAEAALVLALDDDDGLVRRCAGVALLAVAPGVA